LTLIAAVEAALAGRDPLTKAAHWTNRAVRPSPSLKVNAGAFRVRVHREQFKRRNCDLTHDAKPSISCVKSSIFGYGSQVYNSQIYRTPKIENGYLVEQINQALQQRLISRLQRL